ncbi:NRR repressor homolog 1-like [Phragmites australis]|uniref:NRR repressor homolog 1-like n=1 Tax=Phragmites australis TaxID=29695 RepID=UPI002D79E2EF|nr:NRR repressor homolog 1-like [Phragmites australis]
MDGTKAGREKPLSAGSDADAVPSSPRAVRQTPLSEAPAAGGLENAGGGEEEDDEQVERFYALLANIRALRGAYSAAADIGTDGGEAHCGGARKRLTGAEPPWRPAFRLEDFEDAADAETKRRKDSSLSTGKQRADDEECSEAHACRAASSSPPVGEDLQIFHSKKTSWQQENA